MEIDEPKSAAPTVRQMHDRMCFLLGIREAWKVERLWSEEQERQKKYAIERKKIPKNK